MRSDVGLSGSVLGLGLAALRLASLGALPLSSLADHWGRTKVLQRALVLGLLITAAAALSPGYWFFVACFALARPLLTTASTLVLVITVELSTTTLRIQRLAIMAAGLGIGSGLSAILHGFIRGPDSFRWLFALTLVPVFVIVPFLRRIPEPATRSKETPLARLGAVPSEARGRLAVVMTAEVATVVTVSGVAGFAGLFASRSLAGTLGRRWTVALGVVTTAVVSTYAYSGGHVNFVVGYILAVGAGGLLSPAMTALSTEIFAHRFRATSAGWITVAGVVGAVAGLALFGWVGGVVHASSSTGLRLPALVTFLPILPTLLLLVRLPESRGVELT